MMNNDKYYKSINKKSIFFGKTDEFVDATSDVLKYMQDRKYIIMVASNTYKDVLPKAWYADEKYKWTAEDIYECKYKGKKVSKEFVQHISA